MVVPFRESKLTTLFQHALSGEESVTMIVNVSPESSLFNETQQVLRSSAVAKSITSRPLRQLNIKKVDEFVPEEDVSHQPEFTETSKNLEKEQEYIALIEILTKTNCSLKEENEKLKKKIEQLETDVQAEVVCACRKRYDDIREEHKDRVADAEKGIKEICQENFKYQRLLERAGTSNEMNRDPFDCPVSMIESGVIEEVGLNDVTKEKKCISEKNTELMFELESERIKFKELKEYHEKKIIELEESKLELRKDVEKKIIELEESKLELRKDVEELQNEIETLRIELKEKESTIENQTELPFLTEEPSTSGLKKEEERPILQRPIPTEGFSAGKRPKTNLKIPVDIETNAGQNKEKYTCDKCDKFYNHLSSLMRHKKYECGVPSKFTCPHCSFKTKHQHRLRSHISSKH